MQRTQSGEGLTAFLPVLKACSRGFLANVLALSTFIGIVYACLAVSTLFLVVIDQLARASAAGLPALEGSALRLVGASLLVVLCH
jgi:hypothetical protein